MRRRGVVVVLKILTPEKGELQGRSAGRAFESVIHLIRNLRWTGYDSPTYSVGSVARQPPTRDLPPPPGCRKNDDSHGTLITT
jgi:hypothetical protein